MFFKGALKSITLDIYYKKSKIEYNNHFIIAITMN